MGANTWKPWLFSLSICGALTLAGEAIAADFLGAQVQYLLNDSAWEIHGQCAGDKAWSGWAKFSRDGTLQAETECASQWAPHDTRSEGGWYVEGNQLCFRDVTTVGLIDAWGNRDAVFESGTCRRVVKERFGFRLYHTDGRYDWLMQIEKHPEFNDFEKLAAATRKVRGNAASQVAVAPPPPANDEAAQQAAAKLKAEMTAWNAVKDSRDTGALQAFMEAHPTSQFAALAGLKIQQLTALAAARQQGELLEWQALQNSGDIGALQAYVTKYPNGTFTGFAKARVAALEAPPSAPVSAPTEPEADKELAMWESVRDSAAIGDLQSYLARYPGGTYSGEARSRVAILERAAAESRELALWQRARGATRVSDVQAYLDRYPQGRFAADAQARLEVVKQLAAIEGIEFGSYHALIIGIDDYKHLPKLNTAVRDARAVSEVLKRDYGFKVTLLENPDRVAIIDALDELRETLGSNDNLLVYYAGHGWLDTEADRGYWLPVNAKDNRRSRWVSNATISDTLRSLAAKQVMVVADSCYSGTLTRSATAGLKSGDYWKRIAKKRARVALVSGGLEPVADAGVIDTGHSPFAKAFIDALKSNRVVMDGNQLFTSIRRPVMVNAQQTPEYSDVRNAGHDGGDFLFVRKK